MGYVSIALTYRAASPLADIDDLQLALDRICADPTVNPDRIAVFGHSRGGTSALLAAAVDSRIRAVTAIAVVTDLAEYVRRVADFAPAVRAGVVQFMGGEPDAVPERYQATSALQVANQIKQPVLLLHGAAGMRVPLDFSTAMEAELRTHGNDHVHVEVLPGVGHYLELGTSGYQFDLVCKLTEAWLSNAVGIQPNGIDGSAGT
jgi:dipeptidyl aminopeptidase/acylaminoacyl peptidase